MMKYTDFMYLYPPRPENTILPGMLGVFEKNKFIAQIKKNGVCSILCISPDKTMIWKTRHNTDHKAWTPKEINLDPFMRLPKRWYYFCFELLHNKTKDIKNTIYLFDILVANSNYLLDMSYIERYNIMRDLLPPLNIGNQFDTISYPGESNIWVANNYQLGFEHLFSKLDNPEDEGLVLKDPKATLEMCSRVSSNTSGMLKCRKSTKNYTF